MGQEWGGDEGKKQDRKEDTADLISRKWMGAWMVHGWWMDG